MRGLQDAPGQQHQRQGETQGAGPVHALGVGVAGLLHARHAKGQGQAADQRPGDKDPAPAGLFHQDPGEDRTKRQADTKGGAQQAEGTGSRWAVEGLGQGRRTTGQGGGTGQPLDPAQEVQPQQRRHEHQGQGAQAEQRHAEAEQALAAKFVGQGAGGHQHAAKSQHEGIGGPAQGQRAAPQFMADGRGRHRYPDKGQGQHQGRQAHRGQHAMGGLPATLGGLPQG